MTQFAAANTGRSFDVEQRQASVDQLKAQLAGAQYNLDQTVVRAPADGYVTNLALRKGARVAALPLSPVMAFIDTSDTLVGVAIQQIDARYVEPGQNVEIALKFIPGKGPDRASHSGFASAFERTGTALRTCRKPTDAESTPLAVRVKLDDASAARSLPAGSAGIAAIFTGHVRASHIIRKVLLRQIAILNYVNPF